MYIKIGDQEERRIYELGDGMQGLIICTYPFVTETQPGSLFFLEEPDLCMHPSLQRAFLKALKEYHQAKGHQFFLTTHSNHLLDLVDDNGLVSIHKFSEIETTLSEDLSPGDSVSDDEDKNYLFKPSFSIRCAKQKDREILHSLGVRPSATFMANATIWVEGFSDASYLRAYMEAFVSYLEERSGPDWSETLETLRRYREDSHYAFVEYNGANLEHFDFSDYSADEPNSERSSQSQNDHITTRATDLCAEALVIADGDIIDKGDRIDRLAASLRGRLIVLPGKEIENLIPAALMRQQVLDDHASPRHGTVEPSIVDSIKYESYARSRDDDSSLVGIGGYLGIHLGISKYCSSGGSACLSTLPSTYKKRWSSVSEGIPEKICAAIHAKSDSSKDKSDFRMLPCYMTQDLTWLCTLIFEHIAYCNQDSKRVAKLAEFKEFLIRRYHESGPSTPSSWPIPLNMITNDSEDQICILSEFAEMGKSKQPI